jgi:hypothetical protein
MMDKGESKHEKNLVVEIKSYRDVLAEKTDQEEEVVGGGQSINSNVLVSGFHLWIRNQTLEEKL